MRVRYLNWGCVKRGIIYLIGLSDGARTEPSKRIGFCFFMTSWTDIYLVDGSLRAFISRVPIVI